MGIFSLKRDLISFDIFSFNILLLPKCPFLSAVWGGAKLADVLELIGIPKLTDVTPSGGKHVEFVSVDRCKVILSSL